MDKEAANEKPTFSIQLVREVLDCAYDGKSVQRTESVTAQIKWDTPDGQPPKIPTGHSIAGDWKILE